MARFRDRYYKLHRAFEAIEPDPDNVTNRFVRDTADRYLKQIEDMESRLSPDDVERLLNEVSSVLDICDDQESMAFKLGESLSVYMSALEVILQEQAL